MRYIIESTSSRQSREPEEPIYRVGVGRIKRVASCVASQVGSHVKKALKAERFRAKLDDDIAGSNRFSENDYSFEFAASETLGCGCGSCWYPGYPPYTTV